MQDRNSWLLCTLLVIIALMLPEVAMAGPFRTLGYDTSTQSTANSNVSYGDSLGVLYTNPALLSRMPEHASIGVVFWQPNLNIHLFEKPVGSDVPLSIYNSRMGTNPEQQDLAVPTVELWNKRSDTKVDDQYAYVGFGASMELFEGFRFANYMLIPIDSLKIAAIRTNYANENEQHFSNQVHYPLFGEWPKSIDGLMGASYSPWDFLSIGISLKIGVSTVAKMDIYMPDASVQDYSLMNNNTELALALKPIVGIQAQPMDWLSIGFTWRYRSYMKVDGGGKMALWQFHETSSDYTVPKRADQNLTLIVDYEPMEFAGSVGIKKWGFTTQLTVTWNMWHFYLDQHNETPQEAAHFPPSPFYEDPLIGNDGQFKFKDTVSIAWSGQYEYYNKKNQVGEIKAGFSYQPSPVPAQVGRTNYADTDTLCASLGHRLEFEEMGKKFGLDFGMQFWYMVPRTVYKDPSLVVDEFADNTTTIVGDLPIAEAQGLQTNNPGFPGYKMDGWIFLASVSFRYMF